MKLLARYPYAGSVVAEIAAHWCCTASAKQLLAPQDEIHVTLHKSAQPPGRRGHERWALFILYWYILESRWNGVGRQPDLSFLSSPSSYMAPLAQLMLFNVVGVGGVKWWARKEYTPTTRRRSICA